MYRTLSLLALSSLLMAGKCSTNPQIVCPQIRQYTQLTMDKAAAELEKAKLEYPVLTQFVADYGGLRKAIRICQKGA